MHAPPLEDLINPARDHLVRAEGGTIEDLARAVDAVERAAERCATVELATDDRLLHAFGQLLAAALRAIADANDAAAQAERSGDRSLGARLEGLEARLRAGILALYVPVAPRLAAMGA